MPALRNIKHERFVREIIKADGNATEAYRRVYPLAEPRASARSAAARLLAKDTVFRRFEEVHRAMIKRADVTIDKILNEYEEARLLAASQEKAGEMMAASEKKAKLVGLLIDRRENAAAGEYDALNSIQDVLDKVTAEQGPEAAHMLAKAMGLELVGKVEPLKAEERTVAESDIEEMLEMGSPPSDSVN